MAPVTLLFCIPIILHSREFMLQFFYPPLYMYPRHDSVEYLCNTAGHIAASSHPTRIVYVSNHAIGSAAQYALKSITIAVHHLSDCPYACTGAHTNTDSIHIIKPHPASTAFYSRVHKRFQACEMHYCAQVACARLVLRAINTQSTHKNKGWTCGISQYLRTIVRFTSLETLVHSRLKCYDPSLYSLLIL